MSKHVPLGELIDTISVTHKFNKPDLIFLNTSDVSEGKILIDSYMPVNKMKGQAKKTIKNGDILYSEIRPKNRRYAYVNGLKKPEDYVVSTKLMVLRKSSENLNNDYLYHFLTSAKTVNYLQSRAENRIGSFPQITFDIVKALNIWLPELPVQSKIAKVLSDLDKKIELNNKINTELEAMAKLIYDYWFVQFDFPDANGKPYKSSGGKMVYNEMLKREIPDGWVVESLDSIEPNIVTGKTPSTKKIENFNGDVPFICIGDVRGNMHITKTELTLSDVGADSQAKKYIPEGAICVTCIASPGLVGFATGSSQTNQQLNTVVCTQFENKYFLYFYLKDYFRFAKAKSGNTFANMNKGDFSEIKTIHPKNELLIQFADCLKPTIEKVLINSKENNKLTELRDWLLPMLMNGQVTIHNTEKSA